MADIRKGTVISDQQIVIDMFNEDIHAVWLFVTNLGIVFKHLYWLLIASVLLIGLGGMLLSRFDQRPFWKSVYLAFITALTIGYGDMTPHTHRAKVVSIVVGLIGLVITGVVVAAAIKAAEATIEELEMLPVVEDLEHRPIGYFEQSDAHISYSLTVDLSSKVYSTL